MTKGQDGGEGKESGRLATVGASAVVLLSLALTTGLIWLGFQVFSGLDKTVASTLVTAFAAVVVALITTFVGRALERRQVMERAQQEKRVPVYEDFVKGFIRMMEVAIPKNRRKGMSEDEVGKMFGDFTEQVILWGSDDLLKAWVDYRYKLVANPSDGENNLWEMEEFLKVMRKDLGLSNKNLRRGDILRLFINDLPVGTTTFAEGTE